MSQGPRLASRFGQHSGDDRLQADEAEGQVVCSQPERQLTRSGRLRGQQVAVPSVGIAGATDWEQHLDPDCVG
jgi:hypothetical protein